ncbi:MAG TPA: radical SAM protein [Candidatus Omnitrophota bacterium]|nr:radical SAM protein [Candidatus Omnitrophota bacterium]
MCYAIPGRVKSVRDKTVLVDYFGEEKKAYNEIDGLSAGDYIYAQGGYVIEKIPAPEAEAILSVWKETFFELQEVDVLLSRVDLEAKGIDPRVGRILDRAANGRKPSKDEVLELLNHEDTGSLTLFFKIANFLRQKNLKNSCCVHGILEISNYCSESCAYCGISSHHRGLSRYRMSPEEIVSAACEAVGKYGFKALVLQSGEDAGYRVEELAGVIRTIKEKTPALIFVSFGEVGIQGLEKLYQAGARGLLMRFETSNPELYGRFHPGAKLETRLEHLRKAYEMGYMIITGGLIGLPGQTRKDLADDISLTRDLRAEMYSFGPFLPHPETPLGEVLPVGETEVLKVLAASRLIDPLEAKILVTTAFETLSSEARRKGLLAGANSVMMNITPVEYRRQYAIYPNRAWENDLIEKQIEETISLLRSLGRAPTDLSVREKSNP